MEQEYEFTICPRCNGTGLTTPLFDLLFDMPDSEREVCNYCYGSGLKLKSNEYKTGYSNNKARQPDEDVRNGTI